MTMDQAWVYLQNMSLFKASNEVYAVALGIFFWPIVFLFTLFVVAIKTESPAYIFLYSVIGNIALFTLMTDVRTHPIFYATVLLSLTMVLWSLFGSSKVDA